MKTEARNEFRIDPDRLEAEWLAQADVVHDYHLKMADAKQSLDEAKDALEIVYAETDMDVRLHPSKHGLAELDKKPTETMIKNAVLLTKAYQTASEEVIRAKYEVNVLEAACTSLEHKKRALENLVVLWSQDYFAAPRDRTGGLETKQKTAVLGGTKRPATVKSRS